MMDPGPAVTLLDLGGLEHADLSTWFNPFLPHFAREAQRCGGEVRVLRDEVGVVGLVVSDGVERVATVFTRSEPLAETLVRHRGAYGVYADLALDLPREVFGIFAGSPETRLSPHRFGHPIRPVTTHDLPGVIDLMREVYGVVNERWFDRLEGVPEAGFLADLEGQVAGVGWVTTLGTHARLHSLTVRAPYRRMGFGADLLFARLLLARQTGASTVVSEISDRNSASRSITTRQGLERVGEIYFYPPAG